MEQVISNGGEQAQVSDTGVANEAQVQEQVGQAQEFVVPDGYKDKGWVNKIKSADDLWKQLDNAQSLLGKKAVVPNLEGADEKQVEDYLSQLRPADKNDYEIGDFASDEEKGVYRDMLYEAGLSKVQASKLLAKYGEMKTQAQESLYSEDGFVEAMKGAFGDKYDGKLNELKQGLSSVISKEDAEMIESLPNNIAVLMFKIADGFKKSYGANVVEGKAQLNTGNGAVSVGDLDNQIQTLQKELNEKFSGRVPYKASDKSALLKQLGNLQAQKFMNNFNNKL
jgi:hypothetical protein